MFNSQDSACDFAAVLMQKREFITDIRSGLTDMFGAVVLFLYAEIR